MKKALHEWFLFMSFIFAGTAFMALLFGIPPYRQEVFQTAALASIMFGILAINFKEGKPDGIR